MSYVIYNKETSQLWVYTRYRPFRRTESYKTHAAAQAALTRLHRQWLQDNGLPISNDGPLFTYGIAEANHYRQKIERTVVRRNLMTGEEYRESVNTPNYCSPSSEAYWSM